MHAEPSRLVIASRQSRLAMWQAEHVRAALQQLYPRCSVEILGLSTRGDEILDRALSRVGGKGLFVKELQVALADGRADLAVHSMKDVPVEPVDGFCIAATMKRDDPRDAFVSNRWVHLNDLPQGARVGTSSLRREAQLRRARPDLVVEALRGNLDTRLRRLDDGDFDAIVLAAAGLKRLGLAERIRSPLAPEESLPAAGQGALAIEVAVGRPAVEGWVARLGDAESTCCVAAERAVSRALGGSCTVPLAAYAHLEAGELRLRARVFSRDGATLIGADVSGRVEEPEALGGAVARELLARGAGPVLDAARAAA
ncbi:MAG: hydroxymethylbilane synthase [Burkholderiales bacterium]